MHIHTYERYWILAVAATLGVFMAALIAGAVLFGVRLPDNGAFINPLDLGSTEFATPGVRHMGGNKYEVHIVAQMWTFTPTEIRIPEGADVTFYVTSRDVTHGFYIEHHNINLEVVPGHIGRVRTTFNRAGTYRIICHEYCGRGHQLMHSAIIVEASEG